MIELLLLETLNLGHVIAIVVGVLIPLIVWAVTVEKRLEKVSYNHEEIKAIKAEIKDNKLVNQENFDKVLEKLQDIQLQLKDKADK